MIFLFPETCHAGKKHIPPVKHLFGVGIGYQKVVHYKPVLVISKSRRTKHRPPGWGWSGGVGKSGSGGGGGGGGYKSYTPVVLQQKSSGKRGYPHGPPPHHHRRKRKRPQHHHYHHSPSNSGPQHSPMSGPHYSPSSSGPHYGPSSSGPQHSPMSGLHHSPSGSGSRGWGWRQAGRKRPPKNHRKGHDHHHSHSSGGGGYHGHDGGGRNHDDDGDHRGDGGESYRHRPEISDHPPSPTPIHHHHHPEISDHPPSPTPMHHHHDVYRDTGGIWGGGGVSNGGGLVYPSHSSDYFGSPYSTAEDLEEDHGGYESEIREQWNKEEMTSTPSSTSQVSSTPSLYPFEDDREPPKSDTSVTSIHRDFLKNHMKNFHQFQDYQQATTVQPNNNYYKQDYQNAPFLLRPPGPMFSTMDTTSSEERGSGSKTNNLNYDDNDYSYEEKNRADTPNQNYDDTYYDNFDINRRIKTASLQSTQIPSTVQPTSAVNDPLNISGSNNQPQIITAAPKIDTKNFKPSPRVDEMSMGSGNGFNKPGFFPSFEQFQQMKMT